MCMQMFTFMLSLTTFIVLCNSTVNETVDTMFSLCPFNFYFYLVTSSLYSYICIFVQIRYMYVLSEQGKQTGLTFIFLIQNCNTK